ncbi:MAG TPA: NrtA/SsuA/CpmA family ABC transporter substrate-binding protein [Candidatus Binatia bacterium]|jgi:ABC-type nitrate/sulfonate/bicarbonate transport system substrate-binding protein
MMDLFLRLFVWVLFFTSISGAAHSEDKVHLRYGTTISLHNLPVWVAKSTGLFDKNGLDIEVILVRGGSLNLMGIVSERLQLSSVGPEAVVPARLQGADVVLLACASDSDLVYVFKRPDIKNMADLKGKSSAVTRLGGTTHLYLRVALKYFGLDADKDLTVLQMGRSTDVAAALERGQIAVAALPYAYALPLIEKGWPVLIELSKTGFKYPPACVASSRAYVKNNPKVIDGFLRAYVQAIHRIKTDPMVGVDVYTQFTRETNYALIKKVVGIYSETFKRVPYVPDQGIETVLSGLASRQSIPKELSQPEIFRDNGPLETIEKSGFIERLYR